jgi:hypothetical protein
MKFPIRAALVAVALASPLSVVDAQTAQDQDHSAHHPTDKAATPGPRGSMRGAGQPTMGPGGQRQMMSGDSVAMMQMMLPMMRMMMIEQRGLEGSPSPMGLMQPRHVEGRIAYLKAELKITDAQAQQWNAFADALRQSAKAMGTMRQGMLAGDTTLPAPEMVERQVNLLSARLDGLKAIAAAETALYGVLSDQQKKEADDLLSAPMGRM